MSFPIKAGRETLGDQPQCGGLKLIRHLGPDLAFLPARWRRKASGGAQQLGLQPKHELILKGSACILLFLWLVMLFILALLHITSNVIC